jgi:hypothetical protein
MADALRLSTLNQSINSVRLKHYSLVTVIGNVVEAYETDLEPFDQQSVGRAQDVPDRDVTVGQRCAFARPTGLVPQEPSKNHIFP